MIRRLLPYIPALLIAGVILYLSLFHAPRLHLDVENGDKWGHLCAYLALAVSLFLPLWFDKVKGWHICLIILLSAALYGGIIEILQGAFFPPRSAEWGDWFADVLGAAIGYGLSLLICKILNKYVIR